MSGPSRMVSSEGFVRRSIVCPAICLPPLVKPHGLTACSSTKSVLQGNCQLQTDRVDYTGEKNCCGEVVGNANLMMSAGGK